MAVGAPRTINRAVAVSVGFHALALLVTVWIYRPQPSAAPPPAAASVDIDYVPVAHEAPAPSPAHSVAPLSPATSTATTRPPTAHEVHSASASRPATATPSAVPAPPTPEVTSQPTVVPTVQLPVATPPVIDAVGLLRSARTDTDRLLASGDVQLAPSHAVQPNREIVPNEHGTELERATANSAGYIRGMLADTHHHEAPGVRDYYWFLRRRMEEHWTPGITRQPTMLDALLSGVFLPAQALNSVLESAHGQFQTPGAAGSAADALDNAHGPWGSPQTPFRGIVDNSRGNARTTRAEVEVDQDADGTVRSVRIVQSSRIPSYDRAALEAVRAALPMQSAVAMPGGRRSRWSFQVAVSRDPIVPGIGMEFDESTGWFEVHYPGRLHVRSRVWLEHAAPLATAADSSAGG